MFHVPIVSGPGSAADAGEAIAMSAAAAMVPRVKTHRSDTMKLATAIMPTAATFAISTGTPACSTSTDVQRKLPVTDVAPVVIWYRRNRASSPRSAPTWSRHVHRSCQRKLWTTASSTATAVAIW